MRNLRDAPAVVISFVYLVSTLPAFIFALPAILATAGKPNSYYFGFDFTNPVSSITGLLYQLDKLILIIPLVLFLVALVICILFKARKVNSLIVYYYIAIILNIFMIFRVILFSQYVANYYGNLYSNNGNQTLDSLSTGVSTGSSEFQSIVTIIATSVFLLTVLYFLTRYKNLGKEKEVVPATSVSITEVLKK